MANKKNNCQRIFLRVNDLLLIFGPAFHWLGVVSGLSTINGVYDADPVVISVPSLATDGLAEIIGIPAVSCVPAAAGVHATAGIPGDAGLPTAATGVPVVDDVPTAAGVTD
jgi:hypothetical protein